MFGGVVEGIGVLGVGICAVFGMARGVCWVAKGVPARVRGVCRAIGGVLAVTKGVFEGLGRGCRVSRRIIVGARRVFGGVWEACRVTGRVPAGGREMFGQSRGESRIFGVVGGYIWEDVRRGVGGVLGARGGHGRCVGDTLVSKGRRKGKGTGTWDGWCGARQSRGSRDS